MRRIPTLSLIVPALVAPALGQEPLDAALIERIREEGLKRGQVMATLHQLVDVAGSRLTASPGYRTAADWVVKRMAAAGFKASLEPWEFGHPGWTNEHLSVHALTPFTAPLHAEVTAWTPSTRGAVKGAVARLDLPEEPLPEELEAAFKALEGRLKGKVLLVGPLKTPPVLPTRYAPRLEEAELLKRFDPAAPLSPPRPPTDRGAPKRVGALRAKDVDQRIDAFCAAQKALARVNDAGMRNGLIRAFHTRSYDPVKAVPTVVLRNEDFGRIWRLMSDGKEAVLELDIRNTFHPASSKGYNVVAELPGSERPDEVVILGAHLDSWHTGTGATDDGASCAVMMEALRILQASGAKPRRTVRMVLFDGEEQGLLGSQAYVKAHYGSSSEPKPEFGKLVAYFNMDAGAGQVRGLSVFGPPAAAQVLRDLLAPFKDLGAVGANANRSRLPKPDYADITVFSHAGLPAIGLSQDGLEYFETTWHTSVDTIERVPSADLSRTATILASVAYHLANREQPLPRFGKDDLPPIPAMPAATPSGK